MVWSELGSAAAEAAVITAWPSVASYNSVTGSPGEKATAAAVVWGPAGGAAMGALARYHMSDWKKPRGALGRAATEGAIGGAALGLTILAGRKLYAPWSGMSRQQALGLGAVTAAMGTVGLYVGHLAVDAALARK